MGSGYRILLFVLFMSTRTMAQVKVNFSISPPFTPFISDYTRPERLNDIHLSLFNQGQEPVRLKFGMSVRNREKGIEIFLKQTVIPVRPLELEPNELRFVDLDELSSIYGKLQQSDFSISGVDLQALLLDGTIPDGTYELCVQVYDFDAKGFSVPLSDGEPFGCFTFQVNYTDPPRDVRLNGNFLEYRFGGTIPKVAVNGSAGQNYSVQFTPSPVSPGSNYEYELLIFDGETINPKLQQESTVMQGIQSVIPIIQKQSIAPFFFIDASDAPLDFEKEYFLLIRVEDLNEKALFKNGGFSTFQAFSLRDIQPVFLQAPEFVSEVCGQQIKALNVPFQISWNTGFTREQVGLFREHLRTRIKIEKYDPLVIPPSDIFTSGSGEVLLDTFIRYQEGFALLQQIKCRSLLSKFLFEPMRVVVGIRHIMEQGDPLMPPVVFESQGKTQCEFDVFPDAQLQSPDFELAQVYPGPGAGDTLPFQYLPVIVSVRNLSRSDKAVLTQINSKLEPLESNKYLLTSTDQSFNSAFKALSADTAMGQVSRLLNEAAESASNGSGREQELIEQALALMQASRNKISIDIREAAVAGQVPLGQTAKGKLGLLRRAVSYEANSALLGIEAFNNLPELLPCIYLQPFKNNIIWTARVGVYSDNILMNGGISMSDYERAFRTNAFTQEQLSAPMLRAKYGTFSGVYHVGMGVPRLTSRYFGRTLAGSKVRLSFFPSMQPSQLLPPAIETGKVWSEFDSLGVAQQWNLEVSRDPNFTTVDTVIRRRIVKSYSLSGGAGPIVSDLYSEVQLEVKPKVSGTYYWRVYWSNPTLEKGRTLTAAERNYYTGLLDLVASAEQLGESTGFPQHVDSFFFVARPYKISVVDSFSIDLGDGVVVPTDLSLVYPLNGDTIPFAFPPVQFRTSPHKFPLALTKFKSSQEVTDIIHYFMFDTAHEASKELLSISFEALSKEIRNDLLLSGDSFFMANEEAGNRHLDEAMSKVKGAEKLARARLIANPGLNNYLFSTPERSKMISYGVIANRVSDLNELNSDLDMKSPDAHNLLFLRGQKSFQWNADFGMYSAIGDPITSIAEYESRFREGAIFNSSDLSSSDKAGLIRLHGNYTVGMKKPRLTRTYEGREVGMSKFQVSFIPSERPQQLLPDVLQLQAYKGWDSLLVAQQWNIEFSVSTDFRELVMAHSHPVVKRIAVTELGTVLEDELYTQKQIKVHPEKPGKYYYRVSWSNVTDTTAEAKEFIKSQMDVFALATKSSPEDTALNFAKLDIQNNRMFFYNPSRIDSVILVNDSATRQPDCSADCQLSLDATDRKVSEQSVLRGDPVTVGRFTMVVGDVRQNADLSYTGSGTIQCALFPAPIGVQFKNIRLNADRKVVQGDISAKMRDDDLLKRIKLDAGSTKLIDAMVKAGLDYSGSLLRANAPGADSIISELYNFINSPASLLVDVLANNEVNMPFGLSKEVGNFPYTIAITDIRFGPEGARFDACAFLKMQDRGKEFFLGFSAKDLCLTPEGMNLFNSGNLELIGEPVIRFSDQVAFQIHGVHPDSTGFPQSTGTRLVWDCNGFKHLVLKVSTMIDTALMRPVINNKVSRLGQVRATGLAQISDLNNWLLALTFDHPFEFKVLPGFVFTCTGATLDFSESFNAEGQEFPAFYQGEIFPWRGLYIRELNVRLPDLFHEQDTVRGLSFGSRHLMLDHTGLTASLRSTNVLRFEEGRLAGWKYSIDTVRLDIVQTLPRSCAFSGKMAVPIFEEGFNYRLNFSSNRNFDDLLMHLSVTTLGTLSMPAWFATVDLNQGSGIEIKGSIRNKDSLAIQADFSGNISIQADDIAGFKDVRFGTLPFEGLRFRSRPFQPDSMSLTLRTLGGVRMNQVLQSSGGSSGNNGDTSSNASVVQSSGTQKTAGFPINIKDIKIDAKTTPCMFDLNPGETGIRLGLRFKLVVNISDGGENGIGGNCELGMYALIRPLHDVPVVPTGLDVGLIEMKAKLSGVIEVEGAIAFMSNDPVYGNGVMGVLSANIEPCFEVQVSGMFGVVEETRYWMFGAAVGFDPGIPIDFGLNVVYANKFGGEASYHMVRLPGSAASLADGLDPGESPSGAKYLPDSDMGFAFAATLGLTGPPGSPLFGEVTLTAAFNERGGLASLGTEGKMWFTSSDISIAEVVMDGRITINLDRKKLEGGMNAYVNVAGVFRGAHPEGVLYRAGSADFLMDFSRDEWFIKVGNPYVSNGRLTVEFAANGEPLFKAGSYFMAGNKLPQALPPLDKEIQTALNGAGIAVSGNLKGSSEGFAVNMGASVAIPPKNLELGGIFFARIDAKMAVDGVLAPQEFQCSNRNGIGGYYVTARGYGFVDARVGLHVESPFFTGDIIAGEVTAATVVDAGMLNPYFFKGKFRANFSALGGLIEGNQQFTFDIQEDPSCSVVRKQNAVFGGLVADVYPANSQENLSVGVTPTFASNYDIGRPFTITFLDQVGRNVTQTFRIRLVKNVLRDSTNRREVPVNTESGSDKRIKKTIPVSFLRDNRTLYEWKFKLVLEKLDLESNTWRSFKDGKGKTYDTLVRILFRTEDKAVLLPEFVTFTIPQHGERFFKSGDHSVCKLVLRQSDVRQTFFADKYDGRLGDSDFEDAHRQGFSRYFVQYAGALNSERRQVVPITLSGSEIQFACPSNPVVGDVMELRLIKKQLAPGRINPRFQSAIRNFEDGGIDPGTIRDPADRLEPGSSPPPDRTLPPGTEPLDLDEINFRRASAISVVDSNIVIYSVMFKISRFTRMSDKIGALSPLDTTVSLSISQPFVIPLRTAEPFERYEVTRSTYQVPTGLGVHVPQVFSRVSAASSDDNSWMTDFYIPRVFQTGETIRKRIPAEPAFQNRVRTGGQAELLRDAQILEPLAVPPFNYDVRSRDTFLLLIRDHLSRNPVDFEENVSQEGRILHDLMDQNNLQEVIHFLESDDLNLDRSIDESSTSSGSTSTVGPLPGTRLNVRFSQYQNTGADFTRLKNMTRSLVQNNPENWMAPFTVEERNLVTEVNKRTYLFAPPTRSSPFTLILSNHANKGADARILIRNDINDPTPLNLTVPVGNTTTSALSPTIK